MVQEKGKGKEGREVAPLRPLSGLGRMEREMERMFEDFFGRPWLGFGLPDRWRMRGELGIRMPAIEICEEKDDVVIKAELPGIQKEDLDLNITGNILTIKGEKKKEEQVKEKGYYYTERTFGSVERSIEIPVDVQTDKVRAVFKDGILEIRMPKTEEAKRKEVRIRVD